MALIFDSIIHTPAEMGNASFYRKATPARFEAIAGDNPFSLYSFQTDEPTLVGSYNEGTSGFLGNMAWSNAGLRSGNGWYSSYGYSLQAGMKGFGMVNNGGTSNYFGSVVGHSGNSVAGATKFSVVVKFLATSAGEGGAGHLIYKENAYRLYFSAANTLRFEVWDGAAWRGSDTGAKVVYGYWHDLKISYDGSLPAAERIELDLNGRDETVAGANIPAALVDDLSAILYILDNAANSAAWNGLLGLLALMPEVAMSLAEAQSLIELRGYSQATAGNQADIPPGMGIFGPPDYRFVRTNNDHFLTFQVYPLKTAQGTLLIDFAADDVANEQILFGLSQEGVAALAADELTLEVRGDIVNDPLEWMRRTAGAVDLRLSTPFGAGRLGVRTRYILTSDGTAIYAYREGVTQVVSAVVGANTGQWLNSVANANVSVIGRSRTAAPIGDLGGRVSTIKVYDRFMPQTEAQKVVYNIHHSGGSRYYPRA